MIVLLLFVIKKFPSIVVKSKLLCVRDAIIWIRIFVAASQIHPIIFLLWHKTSSHHSHVVMLENCLLALNLDYFFLVHCFVPLKYWFLMNEASQTKGKTEKDSESELLEDRMNVCSFNSVRKSLEQYLISSDVDSTKTFSSCLSTTASYIDRKSQQN